MKNTKERFIAEGFYHVYNRANGADTLFYEEQGYYVFMERLRKYIDPVATIYCHCLMPNHFHLLIRCRPSEELVEEYARTSLRNPYETELFKGLSAEDQEDVISDFVCLQFSRLFNSYSQWHNRVKGRKGNLFMRPFKRKRVDTINYLQKIVHYIHCNPVVAGYCSTPGRYQYSSYGPILSSGDHSHLEVIGWFENEENFEFVHLQPPETTGVNMLF